MNVLGDILTYIRRIIKTQTNAEISDALLIDYVNRFWLMDVDARIQLFDLKTTYRFMTRPAVDKYNMPLYSSQTETTDPQQDIEMFPVYQGFLDPCFINGVQVPLYTQANNFYNMWPNIVQYNSNIGTGDGVTTSFSFTLPILNTNNSILTNPVQGILRGHVDITGIVGTGNNIDPIVGTTIDLNVPVTSVESQVWINTIDSNGDNLIVVDSGQFLNTNIDCGLLMSPGKAPYGNSALSGGYSASSNVVNYLTGEIFVNFPVPPADGAQINVQCFYFETGLPRGILFFNNVLTLRSPPAMQYMVELEAYLSPAAFFNTGQAIPFAYMSEYIARGAARKILSDTGDIEQFQFYEPLFKEQEMLVWKRSQRQFTATRTPTIFTQTNNQFGFNNLGGGAV